MGFFDGKSLGQSLSALLDREKEMILRGDLVSVHKLAPEKERLLRRLARSPLQRAALADLRRRASRNNDLLAASARGYQAVLEHLRQAPTTEDHLKTYGKDGQSDVLGKRNPGFNRRA